MLISIISFSLTYNSVQITANPGESLETAILITENTPVNGNLPSNTNVTVSLGKSTGSGFTYKGSISGSLFFNVIAGYGGQPSDYEFNLTGDAGTDFDLLFWDESGIELGQIATMSNNELGTVVDLSGTIIVIVVPYTGAGNFTLSFREVAKGSSSTNPIPFERDVINNNTLLGIFENETTYLSTTIGSDIGADFRVNFASEMSQELGLKIYDGDNVLVSTLISTGNEQNIDLINKLSEDYLFEVYNINGSGSFNLTAYMLAGISSSHSPVNIALHTNSSFNLPNSLSDMILNITLNDTIPMDYNITLYHSALSEFGIMLFDSNGSYVSQSYDEDYYELIDVSQVTGNYFLFVFSTLFAGDFSVIIIERPMGGSFQNSYKMNLTNQTNGTINHLSLNYYNISFGGNNESYLLELNADQDVKLHVTVYDEQFNYLFTEWNFGAFYPFSILMENMNGIKYIKIFSTYGSSNYTINLEKIEVFTTTINSSPTTNPTTTTTINTSTTTQISQTNSKPTTSIDPTTTTSTSLSSIVSSIKSNTSGTTTKASVIPVTSKSNVLNTISISLIITVLGIRVLIYKKLS